MNTLIDRVLTHLENDIENQDFTAIEELLTSVPKEKLIAYLPEDEQGEFQ